MGLDTVELVMALEDEFGIEVSNEAAEKIATVRDVRDFVVAEIQRRGGVVDPDDVFERIRSVTIRVANVERSAVDLDTKFVDDLGLD